MPPFTFLANAVQYRAGVFEGTRCYETVDGLALFRIDAHLGRLLVSAAEYGIDVPFTAAELKQAVCTAIQRNEFRSCYVRPVCCYGSGLPGVRADSCPVHVPILTWPWAPLSGREAQQSGVRHGFEVDKLSFAHVADGGVRGIYEFDACRTMPDGVDTMRQSFCTSSAMSPKRRQKTSSL